MDTLLLLLVLGAPALGCVLAVIGIIVLSRQLGRATPTRKVWLWICIVLLSLIAFGIGCCYGVMAVS